MGFEKVFCWYFFSWARSRKANRALRCNLLQEAGKRIFAAIPRAKIQNIAKTLLSLYPN
jgi:hypothetical protein